MSLAARSQEVLAHWTDQLGEWLDAREAKEREATTAQDKERKEREEAADREKERKERDEATDREKEERERKEAAAHEREGEEQEKATAGEKEGGVTPADAVEAVNRKEVMAAETRGDSPTCASPRHTANLATPRPLELIVPVVLRRPYAPAPNEFASITQIPAPVDPPGDTAQNEELTPSLEEQQSRTAEVELTQCLEAMEDPLPSTSAETTARPPAQTKPSPTAPAPSAIPMWNEIKLRHDTESKRRTTLGGNCRSTTMSPITYGAFPLAREYTLSSFYCSHS